MSVGFELKEQQNGTFVFYSIVISLIFFSQWVCISFTIKVNKKLLFLQNGDSSGI